MDQTLQESKGLLRMNTTDQKKISLSPKWIPRLRDWPLTGKVWVTIIIVMMSLGLIVALGQIIVHDIIPTFRNSGKLISINYSESESHTNMRGDLFSDISPAKTVTPFYQTDKFLFALKFTHIHVFGMSAIFILMGILVLFLDVSQKIRIWLIVLPFIGVIIDLTSVWLKLFVDPIFFWLHIPGGALFGVVFIVDAVLILWQMWTTPSKKFVED